MAKDERPNEHQEEREFLEGLKARTGRDLAEWMAAIAVQGFSDKNEIIDWLRTQGLPFARASWLERIHRNGGQPIYGGSQPPTALAEAEHTPVAVAHSEERLPGPRRTPAPRAAATPKREREVSPPADAAAELEKVLSAAKGYRPLYQMLEAQIRQAIPAVVVAPQGRYVSLRAPHEFAAVTLHPTEIRLGLDLGDRPFDVQVQQARLRGPGPAITHMVVLTDARQVTAELLALIEAANSRVNS